MRPSHRPKVPHSVGFADAPSSLKRCRKRRGPRKAWGWRLPLVGPNSIALVVAPRLGSAAARFVPSRIQVWYASSIYGRMGPAKQLTWQASERHDRLDLCCTRLGRRHCACASRPAAKAGWYYSGRAVEHQYRTPPFRPQLWHVSGAYSSNPYSLFCK